VTKIEKLLTQLDDAQAALHTARQEAHQARVIYEHRLEHVEMALSAVATALAALRLHQVRM
jgi:hypothetical protein